MKINIINNTDEINNFFETSANPYYLNQESTSKELSTSEGTNPEFGLLRTLSEKIIIENNLTIEPFQIEENQYLEN